MLLEKKRRGLQQLLNSEKTKREVDQEAYSEISSEASSEATSNLTDLTDLPSNLTSNLSSNLPLNPISERNLSLEDDIRVAQLLAQISLDDYEIKSCWALVSKIALKRPLDQVIKPEEIPAEELHGIHPELPLDYIKSFAGVSAEPRVLHPTLLEQPEAQVNYAFAEAKAMREAVKLAEQRRRQALDLGKFTELVKPTHNHELISLKQSREFLDNLVQETSLQAKQDWYLFLESTSQQNLDAISKADVDVYEVTESEVEEVKLEEVKAERAKTAQVEVDKVKLEERNLREAKFEETKLEEKNLEYSHQNSPTTEIAFSTEEFASGEVELEAKSESKSEDKSKLETKLKTESDSKQFPSPKTSTKPTSAPTSHTSSTSTTSTKVPEFIGLFPVDELEALKEEAEVEEKSVESSPT